MIIMSLHRDIKSTNETLGWLTFGPKKWATIERPWISSALTPAGAKGLSCVPPGEYKLEQHNSDAHPRVWALVNHALDIYHWPWEIPKAKKLFARDVCLIHPANWSSELEGCIAPGLKRAYEPPTGQWKVTNSRDAVNEIRSALGSSIDAKIVISEA